MPGASRFANPRVAPVDIDGNVRSERRLSVVDPDALDSE